MSTLIHTTSNPPVSLGLTTKLANTTGLRRGIMTAQVVMKTNSIVAMEGVPGTGKTTCARYVAAKSSRPCAIATMTDRPAPLDLLRHTFKAVSGTRPAPRETRFAMQYELLELLTDWGGVLIIDELQNAEANAMKELVWLYEESDHAFGLIIVGSTVLQAVQRHPQLATRIMGAVTFDPLRGSDMLDAVRQLDPRLADTADQLLLLHNRLSAKGLLRTWVKTVDWLNSLEVPDGPVSGQTFEDIRMAQPKPLQASL